MLPKLINIFWKNLIIFYGDSRDKNSSHHKRKSLFLIFFVDNSGWDKVTNLLISINWKYAPVWINITLTKKMTNSVTPEKSKPWVCFLWTPAVTSVTQRPCLIVSGCKCVNLFIFQWKAPFKSFYLLCLPPCPRLTFMESVVEAIENKLRRQLRRVITSYVFKEYEMSQEKVCHSAGLRKQWIQWKENSIPSRINQKILLFSFWHH